MVVGYGTFVCMHARDVGMSSNSQADLMDRKVY